MPTEVTNSRWSSSNGASLTNTVGGTVGAPANATWARPVVPELRSSSCTSSTSRSSTALNHSAVRSATSRGSTGVRLRAPLTSPPVSFSIRAHRELSNRQVVLAKRPVGMVAESCFAFTETPVPQLGEGEALLEVRYLGIDPTIRGWLDERGNYMAGVGIGEVVRSNGVGVVVETNNSDEYPLGRAFMHLTGWQQYCVVQSNPFPPITMVPENVDVLDVLGVLGHVGITAYVGVLEVARPQPNETFCVSAAASSVGSIAGQIAKMQGATVIGIAGSPEKCAWVTNDLGFDACIDYKTEDVAA